MKKIAVLLFVTILACPSMAATGGKTMPMGMSMDKPMGMGMDMPMMEPMMMKAVGPALMAGCHVDLDLLGVSPEAREAIEDRRFELQKEVIRSAADLKIAEMELSKLLEKRSFDAEATAKKLKEAGTLEMKIRKAHLDFLQFLSTKLSDEEWKKLKSHMDRSSSGSMMGSQTPPPRPMMMDRQGMDKMMMMNKTERPEDKDKAAPAPAESREMKEAPVPEEAKPADPHHE